jgi:hypothetical protein
VYEKLSHRLGGFFLVWIQRDESYLQCNQYKFASFPVNRFPHQSACFCALSEYECFHRTKVGNRGETPWWDVAKTPFYSA